MNHKHAGVLFGGVLFMLVAMGISRFAFTPILPFMRHDAGFSIETAGYLASSNYVGYFIGALWAGFVHRHKKNILLMNVLLNVGSILLMGLLDHFVIWLILRLIAGITGGFIFVLTSSIVMDYLAMHFLTRWSGYVFSGVGLGIAVSGLAVPFFERYYAWQGAWIGLGILAFLSISITLWLWRSLDVKDSVKVSSKTDFHMLKGFMPWLILAYGLEGLGYIITGTFLVDIIHNIPVLSPYSALSWVIVGLAAAPSAPIWMMLVSKYSPVKVLSVAYILQIFGIVLPVFYQTAWSVLLSAALFGLTFIGIVTLSTSYGRQLFPKQSTAVVSLLTTVYAIGQIIGPIVAGNLAAHYNSYKAALLFAGAIVSIALIVMLVGRVKTNHLASANSVAEKPVKV